VRRRGGPQASTKSSTVGTVVRVKIGFPESTVPVVSSSDEPACAGFALLHAARSSESGEERFRVVATDPATPRVYARGLRVFSRPATWLEPSRRTESTSLAQRVMNKPLRAPPGVTHPVTTFPAPARRAVRVTWGPPGDIGGTIRHPWPASDRCCRRSSAADRGGPSSKGHRESSARAFLSVTASNAATW